MNQLDYATAGVDYGPLDAFKRACQRAASTTRDALRSHGFSEPDSVRGESSYLIETPTEFLAHVEEGLGTKNLIADAMSKLTGKCYYRAIGVDVVATIVNDLITCGAMPVSVAMHAAVGAGEWFGDQVRSQELADGFAEGCRLAGAVWGGGETPALKGIVQPETIALAGSAVGRIFPKSRRVSNHVEDQDAIVMLASNGVHTNGLTLCRLAAERLPRGYLTCCSDGTTFGESLLNPSVIYVDFVKRAQLAGVDLHYLVHMTGHGWRKLMRPALNFVYQIDNVGVVPPSLQLLVEQQLISLREAYATFNMGAGFAAYVRADQVDLTLKAAMDSGHAAWRAGTVLSHDDQKAVEISSLNIRFDSDSLKLR